MQSFNSPGKDHPAEKYVRFLIPIGLIAGVVLGFNKIAPTLISFFDNITSMVGSIWGAALVTIPLVFVVLYVLQHPDLIAMTYKNICRKITSFFIKMDFLSYMDSYIETLVEKRKNLQITKTSIEGKKVKLERQIDELMAGIEDNMKKAKAAKGVNKMEQSSLFASIASSDKESVTLYKPIYDRMVRNLTFLEKLDENWGISIIKLKHEVKRKRTEYETIREMYKGLSEAEMFASTDNEKTRIFQESLAALEESVTQKIAAIDDFEKRSKNVMDGIDIEKQMANDDGLKMLEEYEQNGGLFLDVPNTVDGQVTVLSSTPIKNAQFASLLKLKK
jgi:hypothetical protein